MAAEQPLVTSSPAPPAAPPAAPAPARPRAAWRSRLLWLLPLLLVPAGWYAWRWYTRPLPPEVPAQQMEAPVRHLLEEAREQVLRAPYSGAAWGRLGMAFLIHDFKAEADQCFAQTERFEPDEPRWPYYRGWARAMPPVFDLPASIPHLERAVALGQANDLTEPRLMLGEILLQLGWDGEAAEQFRAVLRIDPDSPESHLALGQVAHARGNWETARDHLERCREHPSARKRALDLLVNVYRHLGQGEKARSAAREAAQMPPDQGWERPLIMELQELARSRYYRLKEIMNLMEVGRYEEGLRLQRELTRDYPDAASFLELGKTFVKLENWPEATTALQKAVALSPGTVEAQFYLGIALYSGAERELRRTGNQELFRREIEAAAERFRRAIRLKPAHAFAHYNLGHCLRHQGKIPEALASFQAAVRYKPEFADAHTNLADLLLETGADAEALSHARLALSLAQVKDPRPTRILLRLAGRSTFWR